MGKKGSKRKTRWRTLSIGAPPGEEDEEEGLRKDYAKNQEKDANSHGSFDRNGQGSYKTRRAGTSTSSTSGYGSSGSKSHKDESGSSPSQPKIIFNEDEYTRITTPRQDVLFKKGYLSRKKPWTSNASTSATPSTTESQSASHSTADGSETTEDQQLLDRDSGTGEYPPIMEPDTQLGYGTFYDHTSGYYYEYPVMLVGPAPVPAQVGPNVLAAVPCGPVPLRPIEWINPAFVPKLTNQPYCLMDYQTSQSAETTTIMEEQNGTIVAGDASNGAWNESGTGSASCSGSVAEEIEEQSEEVDRTTEQQQQHTKQQLVEEQQRSEQQRIDRQHLENGVAVDAFLDPLLMQEPPVHVSHIVPTVPQPYIYPGHYMFGPPLVNVNGVTIQSGPLMRTMDVTTTSVACVKRRKKRKKRKQKRPLGNTEDEEEGEYSSECDNDVSSSRLPWSEYNQTSITTAMTAATNRPLNPECQEFQLRPIQSRILPNSILTSTTATVAEKSAANDALNISSPIEAEKAYNASNVQSPTNQEDISICDSEQLVTESPLKNVQSTTIEHKSSVKKREFNGQTKHLKENIETIISISTNETTEMKKNTSIDRKTLSLTDVTDDDDTNSAKYELLKGNNKNTNAELLNTLCREENLTNGDAVLKTINFATSRSRPVSPRDNNTVLAEKLRPRTNDKMEEVQQLQQCNNTIITHTSFVLPKKYNKKGSKFVREPTPGPDLDNAHLDVENAKIVEQFQAIELSHNCNYNVVNAKFNGTEEEMPSEKDISQINDSKNKIDTISQEAIAGSNEDSGFESQTKLSEYPITIAVTEWLRRANSPNVFVTSLSTSDSETDEDKEIDTRPPKNLQGNPMPALSVNSGVDNITMSRMASCGEFAKINNVTINRAETNDVSIIGRRKRDAKGTKRKAAKRIERRNRNVDEKTQNQLVSSLISCNGMLRNYVTAVNVKNLPKNNVGVCEFTEEDSVAGMRVALSSRTNLKKVNARRAKTLKKINRNSVENIDIRMRRINDLSDNNDKKAIQDMVTVRTFVKGEIIVSEDGKLLPSSSYEATSSNNRDISDPVEAATYINITKENAEMHEQIRNGEKEEDESVLMSSVNIEEPDVLECWEAETIEPVVTPRRVLQSPGILCEGEAAEEDNYEIEKATMDCVSMYYRLAQDSAIVIEEKSTSELNSSIVSSKSRTVPNHSEKIMENFYHEKVTIVTPDKGQDIILDEKIPIDEAFEVYESCYTGKSSFLTFDSNIFKQRPLYTQNGEGAIPCKAMCCSIQ